jgi:hypothetical protein
VVYGIHDELVIRLTFRAKGRGRCGSDGIGLVGFSSSDFWWKQGAALPQSGIEQVGQRSGFCFLLHSQQRGQWIFEPGLELVAVAEGRRDAPMHRATTVL